MKRALIIAAIYLLFGLIWIYAGDQIMFSLFGGNIELLQQVGTYKGYAFVVISAALLFFLINRAFKSQVAHEDRLAHELREKNALINNTSDLIWSIDREMKIRSCNEPFLQTIEAITGKRPGPGDSIVGPEYGEALVETWKQYYQRALAGEIIRKNDRTEQNGETFYADISLHPIWHDEQIIGVSCFSKDVTEKTEALLALRASEKRYRQYMERMTSSYAAFDNEWRYTYVNRKAAAVWGKTSEYLVGKVIWEEFPSAVGGPFYQALHKARETQTFLYQEEYYEPWDIWFADFIYPDEDGVSVFFHDITEQKKSQQQLKEREALLFKIYHSTTDAMGMAKVTRPGEFVYISANQTAEKMFLAQGVSMDQYYETELKHFAREVLKITEEAAHELEQAYRQVVETRSPVRRQSSYILRENQVVHTQTTFNPVIDEAGTCTHVLWVMQDVTQQKAAEKILEENRQKLQLIYNSVTEMMALLRCEPAMRYIIESINQPFLEMVKQTYPACQPDQVEGSYLRKSLRDTALAGEDGSVETVAELIGIAVQKKEKIHFEFNRLVKGKVHSYEITATPISGEKEIISHILLVIYDQTEKRYQEEKTFIAINKAVEEERTHIARELHDSLTQTLSVASINLKNLSYDSEGVRAQPKYQNALKYLDAGIDESRSIAHRIMPKAIRDFGLIPSIEELIENIRRLHPVDIQFTYNQVIRLDEECEINLFRIVQQALDNALKHARAQHVEIELLAEGTEIQLRIQDDGAGFTPETGVHVSGGIGIRTMQSRTIQLGGAFSVKSRPNGGTLVFVNMPLNLKIAENEPQD